MNYIKVRFNITGRVCYVYKSRELPRFYLIRGGSPYAHYQEEIDFIKL